MSRCYACRARDSCCLLAFVTTHGYTYRYQESTQILGIGSLYNTATSVVHKHTLVLKRIVQFWRQKRKQELRACRETARYAIEPQIAQSCSCASCTVFCSRTLGNGSRLLASACFQSRSRRKCTPRLGFRTSLRS